MAEYQVTATAKEQAWAGGQHQHIAALCLTGRRVAKSEAIRNIRYGFESYYTLVAGQRANVRVVDRCDQCGTDYLRTDRDSTERNNLLELPDC